MNKVDFEDVGNLVCRVSKSLVAEVLVSASVEESGKIRETIDGGFIAVNYMEAKNTSRVEDYIENIYTNLEDIGEQNATPAQIGLALVAYGAAMLTENSLENIDPALQSFYCQ